MDETKTTGTPEQDGGDALEQPGTTGTPAAEGRDAESQEPDWKAIALEYKGKVEAFNDLKSEVDALKRAQQSPAAGGANESIEDEELSAQERANLQAAASQEGGWWAKAILRNDEMLRRERQEKQQLIVSLLHRDQLMEMPKDERQAVINHFNQNRHRFGDPEAARADLKAKEYEMRLEKLQRENELLKKGPSPEVANAVPTYGRGVSAGELKQKEWTEEAFDTEAARIREQQGELAYLKFLGKAPTKWKR